MSLDDRTEKQTLRLFIGSFLEADAIEAVAGWRETQLGWAAQSGTHVRWVADDQLHLTWRFLGDMPVADVPRLESELTDALKGQEKFTLQFNRLAVWPHAKKPQVLVWLADVTEPCQQVAEAIALDAFSPREHPFKPHITLARFKPTANFRRNPMTLPDDHALAPLNWLVQDVHLVESRLKPTGAEYHLYRRWVLPG